MGYTEHDTDTIFRNIFSSKQGAFIGEEHNSAEIEEFMVSKMATFREMGVGQIYMEMGLVEDMEAYEAFNNAERGTEAWDTTLRDLIIARSDNDSIHSADNRIDMMIAAREAGIQVFPIDYERGDDDKVTVNTRWAETVWDKKSNLKLGERYIVFAGIYHSDDGASLDGRDRSQYLGVDRILDIPSVDLISPNVDQYRNKFSAIKDDLIVSGGTGSDYELVLLEDAQEYFTVDINFWTNQGRLDIAKHFESFIDELMDAKESRQKGNYDQARTHMANAQEKGQTLLGILPEDSGSFRFLAPALETIRQEAETVNFDQGNRVLDNEL